MLIQWTIWLRAWAIVFLFLFYVKGYDNIAWVKACNKKIECLEASSSTTENVLTWLTPLTVTDKLQKWEKLHSQLWSGFHCWKWHNMGLIFLLICPLSLIRILPLSRYKIPWLSITSSGTIKIFPVTYNTKFVLKIMSKWSFDSVTSCYTV